MNDSTLTRPAVDSVYIRALYQAINYRYLFSKALHRFPVSLFGFSDGQSDNEKSFCQTISIFRCQS